MSSHRVSIDSGICIGSGQCALTAPSVFDQDDDGFGLVRSGREDGGGDPLVREAVRVCPVQAISVEEV
ncbi:ferredoxin [Streptomyces roseoverticillatus]|uniref:ferredoxin n=1 Tax=Streptomyces roseoverticillatus TaxID=66429 RepID=UPI001F306BBB|nr:ferredoxin [Streptomyces roseoverticillatus]MCF3104804.1 ferredoxin [Streptomyces roseoverticillatus]